MNKLRQKSKATFPFQAPLITVLYTASINQVLQCIQKDEFLPTYWHNPVWFTAVEAYHIPNILTATRCLLLFTIISCRQNPVPRCRESSSLCGGRGWLNTALLLTKHAGCHLQIKTVRTLGPGQRELLCKTQNSLGTKRIREWQDAD